MVFCDVLLKGDLEPVEPFVFSAELTPKLTPYNEHSKEFCWTLLDYNDRLVESMERFGGTPKRNDQNTSSFRK